MHWYVNVDVQRVLTKAPICHLYSERKRAACPWTNGSCAPYGRSVVAATATCARLHDYWPPERLVASSANSVQRARCDGASAQSLRRGRGGDIYRASSSWFNTISSIISIWSGNTSLAWGNLPPICRLGRWHEMSARAGQPGSGLYHVKAMITWFSDHSLTWMLPGLTGAELQPNLQIDRAPDIGFLFHRQNAEMGFKHKGLAQWYVCVWRREFSSRWKVSVTLMAW